MFFAIGRERPLIAAVLQDELIDARIAYQLG
jgi:hypothetical protein